MLGRSHSGFICDWLRQIMANAPSVPAPLNWVLGRASDILHALRARQSDRQRGNICYRTRDPRTAAPAKSVWAWAVAKTEGFRKREAPQWFNPQG